MNKKIIAALLVASLFVQPVLATPSEEQDRNASVTQSDEATVSVNEIFTETEPEESEIREDDSYLLNYYDIDKEAPEFSNVTSAYSLYDANAATTFPSSFRSDQVDMDGDGVADTSFVSEGFRKQGTYGTCWAFSALQACEASLIRKGLADTSLKLSANHLAYFFYNRLGEVGDLLGNLKYDYNRPVTKTYANQGGNGYLTMWQLASGAGPVNENRGADYQYQSFKDNFALINSTEEAYGKKDYSLKNCYIINTDDTQSMKQMLVDQGALSISYYATTASDSESSKFDSMAAGMDTSDCGSYYCYSDRSTNHAVLLVGWDDNYPASNFATRPEGNGAWLIKNSWGDESDSLSQDGYFWISYYDKGLAEVAFAFDCELAGQYQNQYQYDGACGAESIRIYQAANVFNTSAAHGKDEQIKAVSVGVDQANVNYKMELYTYDGTNPVNTNTLSNGTVAATQSGTFAYAGYHTIELERPVTVSAGQKYAVVFTFTGKAAVNYDYDDNYGWIKFYTDSGQGQSYYKTSSYSSWSDCATQGTYSGNIRIKAFTDNLDVSLLDVSISKNQLSLESGKSETIAAKVTGDSSNNQVVWTTDNSAVAKVSNGVVTATGYGTTVIRATIANGKSAACTVNVSTTNVNTPIVSDVQSTSGTTVEINWVRGSDAQGYVVYRSNSKNSGYKAIKTVMGAFTTQYTDKKAVCGKTYYYKIRYFKVQNGQRVYGAYSKPFKVKAVPAKVEMKTPKASSKKITVAWKKVSKASGYEIYRSTSASSKGKKIAAVSGKKVKYTDKYSAKNKIKKKVLYYYRVRAYQIVNGKKVYGKLSEAKAVYGK